MLLPREVPFLVAAALVDPKRALGTPQAMLETVSPEGLAPALMLLAQSATREGLGDAVCEKAKQEDFITVQAAWTEAAAAGGALGGPALVEHVRELAPRAADELDPGRELLAGLPLVMALAHGGAAEELPGQAVAWRLPPPLLADQAFQAGLRLPASVLRPGRTRTGMVWSLCDFRWWRDTAGRKQTGGWPARVFWNWRRTPMVAPARSPPGSACHWPVAPHRGATESMGLRADRETMPVRRNGLMDSLLRRRGFGAMPPYGIARRKLTRNLRRQV
jgi:hypothetical protein